MTKNHFDRAADRLRRQSFIAGHERMSAGRKAAQRYESYPKAAMDDQTITRDRDSVHTSDGVPLFDQDFMRMNKDQFKGE